MKNTSNMGINQIGAHGFFWGMFMPSWGNFEHDHKVIMIHEARYKPANVVWVFDFSIAMFTFERGEDGLNVSELVL